MRVFTVASGMPTILATSSIDCSRGVIEANSIGTKNGMIVQAAGTARGAQGRDESRKGRRARGSEAASWPQPANRNTTQDAGAIASGVNIKPRRAE
jgi:hypothetical protein